MVRSLGFGRAGRVAAAVALAASISACGAEGIETIGEDPRLFTHPFDSHDYLSPDHTIGGELRYNGHTGCMYLRDRVFKLLVWPRGVAPVLENGEHGVNFPNYGTILHGRDIKVSYLFVPEEQLQTLEGAEAIQGCLSDGGVVFINDVHD